jgi:hypothetical protein
MRQDLQIDAGLVHLTDAQRAEVIEPLDFIFLPMLDLSRRSFSVSRRYPLGAAYC